MASHLTALVCAVLVVDPVKLRAAREAAGLGLRATARQIGKRHQTLLAYERGGAVPPGNVLLMLARLYGVSAESLCTEAAPDGDR